MPFVLGSLPQLFLEGWPVDPFIPPFHTICTFHAMNYSIKIVVKELFAKVAVIAICGEEGSNGHSFYRPNVLTN